MKPLFWVGSAHRDLVAMPDEIKDNFGFALSEVQAGRYPAIAKPWKGLKGVHELVADHRNDTYRSVFTLEIGGAVYVVHCFQKKSNRGIATPQVDKHLVAARIRAVRAKLKEQGR